MLTWMLPSIKKNNETLKVIYLEITVNNEQTGMINYPKENFKGKSCAKIRKTTLPDLTVLPCLNIQACR